jgi:hypothetical protein
MTETIDIDVSTLLPWSEGRRLDTRNGPKILHEALPTQEFWKLWSSNKDALKMHGVSLNRHYQHGHWVVNWWKDVPKEELEQMQRAIESSQRVEVDIEIPKPDNGMDYFAYQKAGIARVLQIFGRL